MKLRVAVRNQSKEPRAQPIKPKHTKKNPSQPKLEMKCDKAGTVKQMRHKKTLQVQSRHQQSPQETQPEDNYSITKFFSKTTDTRGTENDAQNNSNKSLSNWRGPVASYENEITKYMNKRQKQYPFAVTYPSTHKIINQRLRTYLVRHMYRQYKKYQLLRTTLHIAVFYMDSFFSKDYTFQSQLEAVLASQACLLMAMKMEEIYPPSLGQWTNKQHHEAIYQFQAQIMKSLNYQLCHWTVVNRLELIEWEKSDRLTERAKFLADLTLFDMNVRQICPSMIAQAIWSLSQQSQPNDDKQTLAVKWMVERNAENVKWLKDQSYAYLDLF